MKIPLYSQDGAKSEIEVSEKIFGRKANKALIHRILLLQLANRRRPVAHALTKGEVSGGGKKPYRQKGTGWARQGSIRNPHFKGGGVAFGPRNVRNFTLKASKKERRGALLGALMEKASEGQISALEGFQAADASAPKTKTFAVMLRALPFKKDILFVLPQKNPVFERSSRNIPHVKTLLVNYLNIDDLLKYHDVVFLKEALKKAEAIFAK